MDAVHLHLVLNHFPIIGTLTGVGVLIYGIFINNDHIKKVAMVIFVIMSLLTIPAYLTGEEAEETIENIAGISEKLIENHEEFAEIAIIFMGFLAILSIISLISLYKKYKFSKIISIITLIVSILTFGFFAQLGNLGGQIRHSEIRKDFNKNKLNTTTKEFKYEKENDDD